MQDDGHLQDRTAKRLRQGPPSPAEPACTGLGCTGPASPLAVTGADKKQKPASTGPEKSLGAERHHYQHRSCSNPQPAAPASGPAAAAQVRSSSPPCPSQLLQGAQLSAWLLNNLLQHVRCRRGSSQQLYLACMQASGPCAECRAAKHWPHAAGSPEHYRYDSLPCSSAKQGRCSPCMQTPRNWTATSQVQEDAKLNLTRLDKALEASLGPAAMLQASNYNWLVVAW